MSNRPEFATNNPVAPGSAIPGETVADAITGLVDGLVAKLKEPPRLDVATAYFNVGGFNLLAEALETVGPVRLLLGSEPSEFEVRSTITPLSVREAHRGDPRRDEANAAYLGALAQDRDLVGFGREADSASERLVTWLRRGDVEVRRLTRGFLHGKAFILRHDGDAALAGSANLTYAGLARNKELVLGVYHPSTVDRVHEWFEEQWGEAEDFDLADLYEARRVPHNPWHVFLRMLLALYGNDLDTDLKTTNELGLSDFQVDGVWRAQRILDRRGGVIVADEVGLGKTFIAGELIRQAAVVRRQKVLVIAPATLRDSTWNPFLREKNIRADVVSYEELVRELDTAGTAASKLQDLDEYAMVVVDEAHNLRNAATQRADAMRELLGGSVGKDLLLLTATPVNNSLQDLQTLVGYISPSDTAFADVGVRSVRQYIGTAMALDPEELSGQHLFELLDAIAVRRTRRFIKTQYPNALINGKPIVFPQAVVQRVDYDLDAVLPGFFGIFAHALGADRDEIGAVRPGGEPDPDVLTMARYVPSRFLLGSAPEEQFQVQNAGLLQSALLKRFESSAIAFTRTVRTMIASQDQFLAALDGGWVLTGDALRSWVASDTDDVDQLVAELDDEARDNAQPATTYDVAALRAAVESDRALLDRLAAASGTVTAANDPKIDALVERLAEIAHSARQEGIGDEDTRDRRKVLIFTYFADTAQHIHDALCHRIDTDERLAAYRGRLVMATGRDRDERQKAIVGFAPRTAGTAQNEDLFDIAVATDVLSEGVNLQQAGRIINYDLPWNPMRLVQRHGRVDRIGSPHRHIYLACFFPDDELEDLLDLEARLQRKINQAAAAFGTSAILPGVEEVDRVLAETRDQITRLREEEASLFGDEVGAAASSEEFQRRLARAFSSSPVTKRAVENLPWGAGSGIVRDGDGPGIVYCVRIADHPRPQFRYVPLEHADDGHYEPRRLEGKPEIVDRLLACLTHADPRSPDAEAVLPRELHDAVLDTWPLVQQAIYDDWMAQADPATVEPSIPRAMLDASELIRWHGGFLGERQDALVQRYGQVVDNRIVRDVRGTLRRYEGEAEAGVRALAELADALRLPIPVPVEPLPEIELDDVRVLCWMAVQGRPERGP
ncbi:helicase [Luteimicrobium album]|uniref:Helicase n=1 Tax=Luteimicrobium album TaxID=1054550 RepID=A0ABQ6HZG8_9MICO|nr:helicase-related protein [Luteimicrobium album]GMA23114.1 helicase [Luteimicrobium album]